MKRGVIGAIVAGVVFITTMGAEASWMLDEARFHSSAHGQIGCQECHYAISDESVHPDPSNVKRSKVDFFEAQQCLDCHDDIMDDLESGTHGSRQVKDKEKYGLCIRCHKPHYLQSRGENAAGEFDPSRPRHLQCGACHEERSKLPALSEDDEACMTCHREVDPVTAEGEKQVISLCINCHGAGEKETQKITSKALPLIDLKDYENTPHASMACTTCHPNAAQYYHHEQKPGDCTRCHNPHDEKMAHDAHVGVSCEACHLKGVNAVKDEDTNRIMWEKPASTDAKLAVHEMIRFEDDDSCKRCHSSGNDLGAAAMVLPAKGVLCMPCHIATFSAGDTVTLLSLLVFLFGVAAFFSVFLSGSIHGKEGLGVFSKLGVLLGSAFGAVFSKKIGAIIKTLFFDVLLQRRLYLQSPTRWLIHSLIFLPFVFRFFWGLFALLGSLWHPSESSFIWDMVYKNHPLTAFLYDLTGLMIITGIIFAFVRGLFRQVNPARGLPRQDRLALGLIGGIAVVGFILEGIRIAMTGRPDNSGYAFLGYIISLVFSGTWLTGIYGFIWYLHAILTGIFVAYLPFSRLFHIILGPVMLSMRAAANEDHQD